MNGVRPGTQFTRVWEKPFHLVDGTASGEPIFYIDCRFVFLVVVWTLASVDT